MRSSPSVRRLTGQISSATTQHQYIFKNSSPWYHPLNHYYRTIRVSQSPPTIAKKLAGGQNGIPGMVNLGICRPFSNSWASTLHMVSKKDGSWRPCGHYRALNTIIKPDRYPIPHIHDFNSQLVNKNIFSKIALVRDYHNIPMTAEEIPITAIVTPFGLFEFVHFSFGFRNDQQSF